MYSVETDVLSTTKLLFSMFHFTLKNSVLWQNGTSILPAINRWVDCKPLSIMSITNSNIDKNKLSIYRLQSWVYLIVSYVATLFLVCSIIIWKLKSRKIVAFSTLLIISRLVLIKHVFPTFSRNAKITISIYEILSTCSFLKHIISPLSCLHTIYRIEFYSLPS